MADRWEKLHEQVVHWLAAAETDEEWAAFNKVAEFMAELEQTIAETPTPHPTEAPWGYAEPWNFSEDQVFEWASNALKGAPEPLVRLCAEIAWSVLQGANPDPDERAVHVESIKSVAALFDNGTAAQVTTVGGLTGSVTSGIVD